MRNTFTLFNLVNLVLALMVAAVGSYKNILFIFVAIANTLISIINELRAKKIVDKLKLLSEQRPTILKNGRPTQVAPEAVQKGDFTILSLGDQVLYDSVVEQGTIEVNEAFITGEQDPIVKHPGDQLSSGSFVVAGTARARVERVGADNSLTKLEQEAHTIKTADSQLFTLMNNIVKYISYALIPIGALLLWARFRTEPDAATAVTSTVAALINMIPEGLILLTSSVLALATIRLSKKQVLVQDLYSIETLARVDTICLDKTGTLTTGKMTVEQILLPDGTPVNLKTNHTPAENRLLMVLAAILSHQTSENATITALRTKLAKSAKNRATEQIGEITEVIPFSSDRKYSGIVTKKATFLMGAVEFLTDDQGIINQVKSLSGNYRMLAVVESDSENGLSKGVRSLARRRVAPAARGDGPAGRAPREAILESQSKLLGIVRLSDELRRDAKGIINYFYNNNITVKIISGDDLKAVTSIAKQVGVKDLRGVNLASLKSKNYPKLVQDYGIFTRVTPTEKKQLIAALKKQGSTVAMTGDGVNDILAMKEADVSLAIGEGSDAARRASKLVLLNSGFSAVPSIVDEGRQSINNLERSTSLFLAKTVYASILAIFFTILPLSYPFSPIEMTLLNFACIGFPGLILALEHNTSRIKNQFRSNILTYSVPVGLTVSIAMLALAVTAEVMQFTRPELTTASVFITFVIDIALIYWISKPLNKLRATLLALIVAIFATVYLVPFVRNFFEFVYLPVSVILATFTITATALLLFTLLRLLSRRFLHPAKNTPVE